MKPIPIPRRELLKLAGLSGVVATGSLGACSPPAVRARDQRILVHVELRGGNDGLNSVVPYSDPRYRAARPLLALSEVQICRVDDRFGFHPNLGPLLPLWNRGNMAVMQSVGTPRPDRSHFFTRRVWETGDPQGQTRDGWIGRLLEQGSNPSPVCVAEEPLALCSSRGTMPCVVRDLFDLEFASQAVTTIGIENWIDLLAESPFDGQLSGMERRARCAAIDLSRRMSELPNEPRPEPSTLVQRLDTIAAMIELDLGPRVYAAMLNGFDTHVAQPYRHAVLLQEFAEAVAAFFARLERSGNDGGVLLVAWSEFGRRDAENGGGGTDHGLAGPAFAFGPQVQGGMYGPTPDLSDLDGGDLRARLDLRRLAADVAEHLDLDLAPVLGPGIKPVGFAS